MGLTPAGGLLAAASLHLGFQAVVSAVVYPALAEVPPERWPQAHAAHSRRVALVVGPVYALLGTACLRVLVTGPRSPLLLLAVGGAAGAAASTAVVAAPTHRRLGEEGPTDDGLSRLRTADRVRLCGAVVAGGAALAAVLTD
ncbi:hypothetical protein [Cellulomonas sp. ATA003]|uniref:hypothetical protein n=1 Tax=Cellulomonas sp. ATA003 TaxID=3073064 RepID=UPI002873A940|nr:hypothetical protein [Cellulomonas sp. ATA003]WNB84326.1 hypothetical protein REH70_10565 [Cellulomonas sp. ATA003]